MAMGMIGAAAVGGALSAGGALAAGGQSARAMERSYKKRYQWQVADLKKAGLNPMLAVMNGAPVPQSPQFPNVGEAAVEGAAAAAQGVSSAKLAKETQLNIAFDTNLKNEQAGAAQASARAADATARLNNAEAALKEYRLPYGAKNAEVESLTLDRQFQILGRELEIKGYQSGMSLIELQNLPDVKALQVEYQRLINQATRLGMNEKEADAAFWSSLPESKYGKELIPLLKMILK